MKWAFWRRRKSRNSGGRRADPRAASDASDAAAAGRSGAGAAERAEQAEQLRARARRRLIGAAVLLLGAAVFVPMFLDPAPRPLPDNIPIDIPSDRTPFAPRLSLPAEPPAEHPADAPAQDVQDSAPPAGSEAGKAADAKTESKPESGGAEGGKPDAGRWVVQAAALSSQSAAQKLAERLSKAGLRPYVERAGGSEATVYRVRFGPYASKEGASRMRRRLEGLGVDSTVVRVEAGGR